MRSSGDIVNSLHAAEETPISRQRPRTFPALTVTTGGWNWSAPIVPGDSSYLTEASVG